VKSAPSLKKRSSTMKPTVWIGKQGVDQDVLDQILTQTRTKGLVKIKLQQPVYTPQALEEIVQKIVQGTAARLVDKRGRTFTIFKEPQPKDKK